VFLFYVKPDAGLGISTGPCYSFTATPCTIIYRSS
jgi:hypothetical protein